MASYPPPSDKFDFKNYNPEYFIGKEEDEQQITENPEIELNSLLNSYVKRDGSNIMTGGLTTPAIQIFNDGSILFSDNTTQNTAFKLLDRQNISLNTNKLSRITYDEDDEITDIQGSLKVKKIIFSDDSNKEQVIAFDTIKNNDVINTKQKTQGLEYDEDLTKTTINNSCYINSLSCGNINTTHLNNTNSNIQEQITALNNAYTVPIADIESNKIKTTGLSYIDDENLTKTTIINDNCFINNLSCNNFNTEHLQNTTSNIQEQINNNSNLLSGFESSETLGLSQITVDANAIFSPSCFVKFQDGQYQNHAFSDILYNKLVNTSYIDANNLLSSTLVYDLGNNKRLSDVLNETGIKLDDLETKTTNIEYNDAISTTYMNGNTSLNRLVCGDMNFPDGTQQTTAYSSTDKNKVNSFYLNGIGKIATPSLGNGLVNDSHLSKLENISVNIQDKFDQNDNRITSVENRATSLEIADFQNKDRIIQLETKNKNFTFTMSGNSLIDGIPVTPGNQQTYEGNSQWFSIYYLYPQSTRDSGLIGGSNFGTFDSSIINGRYLLSGWFKFTNLRWVQKLTTTIKVHNSDQGDTIQTLPCGIVRDASLSEEPDILYQIPPIYFSTSSVSGAYFEIFTEYHLNTFSNSEFTGQIQIVEI